jgi:hypothetical protein
VNYELIGCTPKRNDYFCGRDVSVAECFPLACSSFRRSSINDLDHKFCEPPEWRMLPHHMPIYWVFRSNLSPSVSIRALFSFSSQDRFSDHVVVERDSFVRRIEIQQKTMIPGGIFISTATFPPAFESSSLTGQKLIKADWPERCIIEAPTAVSFLEAIADTSDLCPPVNPIRQVVIPMRLSDQL